MKPMVTLCVPTYNSSRTIEETLRSLINQNYSNYVIHVVDNASNDDTVDTIQDMGEAKVILHTNTMHETAAEGNWNRCFQYMQGKYSMICHSDDLYSKYMLSKQVEVLETNPDVCAVFTGAGHIDENSHSIGKPISIVDDYKNLKKLTERDVLISSLKHGNTLFTPSAMVISEVYKGLAPFNYDAFKYSSDLDMWLRAAKHSHIMVIDLPLIQYRISSRQGSSAIHNLRTSEEAFFTTIDHHMKNHVYLPQDVIDLYEMRRLEDKAKTTINSIKKLGLKFPGMVYWGIKQKVVGR
jgi:glycosyltransferase involved in cell wall biosynthesis